MTSTRRGRNPIHEVVDLGDGEVEEGTWRNATESTMTGTSNATPKTGESRCWFETGLSKHFSFVCVSFVFLNFSQKHFFPLCLVQLMECHQENKGNPILAVALGQKPKCSYPHHHAAQRTPTEFMQVLGLFACCGPKAYLPLHYCPYHHIQVWYYDMKMMMVT
ncbi:unnamed protein product [Lathyrus oleraceus]